MPNIPTPEQAELFAQSVRKWQQVLSLGDWRIEKGIKPAKGAMASVEFTPAAIAVLRQATALAPKRNKASDGLLPSKAHIKASPDSDHNTGLAVDQKAVTNKERTGTTATITSNAHGYVAGDTIYVICII